MLADFGADVVKVEPPDGDGSRRWGRQVNGVGPFFSLQNCGKRSVSVDLSTQTARELCRRLAAVADVVVENFRPGVMARWGLSFPDLHPVNRGLIYGSITGYGPSGERAQRRAFANVIHADAGLLERQARRDGRPPTPIRWSAADTYSSLELLAGILAALYHRQITGAGQLVEVAMVDAMLAVDDFAAFDLWGPTDVGGFPDPVLLQTLDGYVMVSANPALVPDAFLAAIGGEELLSDERFSSAAARLQNRDELVAEIESRTAMIPGETVEHAFDDAGLAVARLVTTPEAVERAAAEDRRTIVEVDDRSGGRARVINSPQRFSAAESGIRGVVPLRGEHNREVLAEWLGAPEDEVVRLVESGVLV